MNQVVRNVEKVIAIELLAACQAIEFLRPLKTTAPLEEVYKAVRSVARPWDKDRCVMAQMICVGCVINNFAITYYRYMSPDIDAVNKLLKQEKVWQVVRAHMEEYHMS